MPYFALLPMHQTHPPSSLLLSSPTSDQLDRRSSLPIIELAQRRHLSLTSNTHEFPTILILIPTTNFTPPTPSYDNASLASARLHPRQPRRPPLNRRDAPVVVSKLPELEELRELVSKQKDHNEELKEIMNTKDEQHNTRIKQFERQLQSAITVINAFKELQK